MLRANTQSGCGATRDTRILPAASMDLKAANGAKETGSDARMLPLDLN
jgi:hypothetical protein